MGTHNRLIGLDAGEYLEAIAVDPDAPAPDGARWFDLDRRSGPPRLSNWILRVDDLEAAVAAHPGAGRPVPFARDALRWRMAVPEDGALPFDGCFPALIQWDTPPPDFADAGLRLAELRLTHPEAGRLRGVLAVLTDDPRITVAEGAAGLSARIATPRGPRVLT